MISREGGQAMYNRSSRPSLDLIGPRPQGITPTPGTRAVKRSNMTIHLTRSQRINMPVDSLSSALFAGR